MFARFLATLAYLPIPIILPHCNPPAPISGRLPMSRFLLPAGCSPRGDSSRSSLAEAAPGVGTIPLMDGHLPVTEPAGGRPPAAAAAAAADPWWRPSDVPPPPPPLPPPPSSLVRSDYGDSVSAWTSSRHLPRAESLSWRPADGPAPAPDRSSRSGWSPRAVSGAPW